MTNRTIAVVGAALVGLAGCGGHARRASPPSPTLPRDVAQQLAAESDGIAARLDAGDGCGALALARDLQQRTIAAVNTHQVPAPFQEPLGSAVADLTARISCTPAVPTEQHDHGKHNGQGDNKQGEGGG